MHTVEVRYAGIVIARTSDARAADGALFVPVPEPMPVGTPVDLRIGERAFEAKVARVTESADSALAGMVLAASAEAVARALGSEAGAPPAAPLPPAGPAPVEATPLAAATGPADRGLPEAAPAAEASPQSGGGSPTVAGEAQATAPPSAGAGAAVDAVPPVVVDSLSQPWGAGDGTSAGEPPSDAASPDEGSPLESAIASATGDTVPPPPQADGSPGTYAFKAKKNKKKRR